MVRIDHEHRAGRTSVLASEVRVIRGSRLGALRQVLRVVDDGPNELSATEIVCLVRANFHFEMAEARSHGLLSETGDLLVGVSLEMEVHILGMRKVGKQTEPAS